MKKQSLIPPCNEGSSPVQGAEGAAQSFATDADLDELGAILVSKQSPADLDAEVARLLSLLDETRIKPDEPITPDEYLFRWGGVDFAPRRNIVSLKGRAKSGKTFVLSAFVIAFLNGNFEGLESYAGSEDKVFIIDTEQSKTDSQKTFKRIMDKAPSARNRLDICNVRCLDSQTRMDAIEAQARISRPGLIVVDGIADLIVGMDYNDQAAAEAVITRLMRIAEEINAVVITAIHTNKNDDNASGWLGKILQQKCAVELQITRPKDTEARFVECSAIRHREIKAIPYNIINTADNIGAVTILSPAAIEAKQAEAKKAEYIAKLAALGFTEPFCESRAHFRARYQTAKQAMEGVECSRQTANGFIQRCIDAGVFRVDEDNLLFDR